MDQEKKASGAEKKHFVVEIRGLKEQIKGMNKELAVARGQATKMQQRINEIRQKARETQWDIRAAETKRSVSKGCGHS